MYRKVTGDETMAGLFEPVDMIRFHGDQVAFLTKALGGPDEFSGEAMATAFAQLKQAGFADHHFDAMLGYMGESLTTLDVAADIILAVLQIVEGTRPDMVGDHAEPTPAESADAPAPVAMAAADSLEPAPEAGGPTKESAVANQSIRVNVELLEDLMTMVSELVLTRNQLM